MQGKYRDEKNNLYISKKLKTCLSLLDIEGVKSVFNIIGI